MGSFSWLKADKETEIKNVVYGSTFKFLIPIEFGGGFIKDKYQDYGYLGIKNGEPKYDMYEILAFWNAPDKVRYDGDFPLLKEIDQYTDENRNIGIDIGCYNKDIDKLKFPLKLVSATFNGTYEDLDRPSYGDPEQGFGRTKRSKEEVNEGYIENERRKNKKLTNEYIEISKDSKLYVDKTILLKKLEFISKVDKSNINTIKIDIYERIKDMNREILIKNKELSIFNILKHKDVLGLMHIEKAVKNNEKLLDILEDIAEEINLELKEKSIFNLDF